HRDRLRGDVPQLDVRADDLGIEGRRPVRRHAGHRRVALNAHGAIFQNLRASRWARHLKRSLAHADPAACQHPHYRATAMNTDAQRRAAGAPVPAAGSAAEARKLAENLIEVMSALVSVFERETELVRAGKLREAMKLEPQKSELSRRYVGAIGHLKASQ